MEILELENCRIISRSSIFFFFFFLKIRGNCVDLVDLTETEVCDDPLHENLNT